MPIITISHDTYDKAEDLAEVVAGKLRFQCIGPEIIHKACEHLQFPSATFQEAVNTAPNVFEKVLAKKEQHLALFRSIFFEYMAQDNVVYHGLAGHIFLADVPNVLKVRITADFEDRIKEKTQKEKVSHVPARKLLRQEDRNREKWTRYFYGKDNRDPLHYDFYLNLQNISLDQAAVIIIDSARLVKNRNGKMMRRRLEDLALAAKVEAVLLEVFPEVEAAARKGEVYVSVNGSILQERTVMEKAKKMVSGIQGIRKLNVGIAPSIYVPF